MNEPIVMTKSNYYSIGCGFFGICLFLYGFFLSSCFTKNHSFFVDEQTNPRNGWNITSDRTSPKPQVERIVIMVIDGLRNDFVSGKHVSRDMPYLSSLLQNRDTCVYPCKVHVPTVTMPRIKALSVGTISNFVDIALNFGSTRVHSDNILAQAVKMNKKIVFYGDDTWIKLFPDTFSRFEGTVSFFVTDYTEVDTNVTRNVLKEIRNDDWDIMILHYLGLDHIGHLEGPYSPKISWKLKEMDDVIRKINRRLVQWKKKKNADYIMVVCGDHGMKDTGGHGGSTTGETVVGFVTTGVPCSAEKEIYQVDIAVTLSVLMGLPVPRENVGKVIRGLVKNLPLPKQAHAYFKNTVQLMENFENIMGSSNLNLGDVSLETAVKLHNRGRYEDAVKVYQSLLSYLSSKLIESLTKFDTLCLFFGVLLIFQASYLPNIIALRNIYILVELVAVVTFLTCILYAMCYTYSSNSLICDLTIPIILLNVFILFIISFNLLLLFKSFKLSFRRLKNVYHGLLSDRVLLFIVFCSLLFIVSTHSTSFIEEEHMIWYFYWTSFLIVLITDLTKRNDIALVFSLLVLHRILCKLNQTGIQWDSLPDIGDWLTVPENKFFLSFYTLISLLWAYVSLHRNNFKKRKKENHRKECSMLNLLSNVCNVVCLAMVFVFRAAVNDISIFPVFKPLLSDKGISEFRFFVFLFTITVVVNFVYVYVHRSCKHCNKSYAGEVIMSVIDLWTLASCMLLRAHNTMLPGSLRFVSRTICIVLKNQPNKIIKLVIVHHWLARIYFFYQGNSNSLASVDLATGYIGQTEYNAVKIGTLIICATYAMPILAYLLLMYHFNRVLVKNYVKAEWNMYRSSAQLAIDSLLVMENLHLFFYVAVIIFHRYHIFIWSVFSPKLIYLSAYFLLLYPVILILQFILNMRPRHCTKR